MDHTFRFKGGPQRSCLTEPQFITDFWKNFWKLLGTTTALTASYHPQLNPVERLNLTDVQGLKSFINARQDDWNDKMILFELPTMGPQTQFQDKLHSSETWYVIQEFLQSKI